jgi:hypothetical protein
MHKQWKDFIDYKEIPFVEYYDDLKKFIVTKKGKICEAMSIICASASPKTQLKVDYNKLNEEDIFIKFDELTNKYMQKSKYDLAIYWRKDKHSDNDLKILKSHTDDPMWNLCIYSSCHNLNTNIMYPFLCSMYPDNVIRVVESCQHSCVVDMTTRKIYDLAMWNEITNDSIILDLIKDVDYDGDHYDLHNGFSLMENNFMVKWLWNNNNKLYDLAVAFCNTKYKTK